MHRGGWDSGPSFRMIFFFTHRLRKRQQTFRFVNPISYAVAVLTGRFFLFFSFSGTIGKYIKGRFFYEQSSYSHKKVGWYAPHMWNFHLLRTLSVELLPFSGVHYLFYDMYYRWWNRKLLMNSTKKHFRPFYEMLFVQHIRECTAKSSLWTTAHCKLSKKCSIDRTTISNIYLKCHWCRKQFLNFFPLLSFTLYSCITQRQ